VSKSRGGGSFASFPPPPALATALPRVGGRGGLLLLGPRVARAAAIQPAAHLRSDSLVLRWNAAALQCIRESRLGPPMVSRALAVAHTLHLRRLGRV
jgi:hypothetical protein